MSCKDNSHVLLRQFLCHVKTILMPSVKTLSCSATHSVVLPNVCLLLCEGLNTMTTNSIDNTWQLNALNLNIHYSLIELQHVLLHSVWFDHVHLSEEIDNVWFLRMYTRKMDFANITVHCCQFAGRTWLELSWASKNDQSTWQAIISCCTEWWSGCWIIIITSVLVGSCFLINLNFVHYLVVI